MTERDREAVLSEYFRMFEEAEDDFAVIEQLGSPTRAAVTALRDYKPSAEDGEVKTPAVAAAVDAPAPVSAAIESVPDASAEPAAVVYDEVPPAEEVLPDQLSLEDLSEEAPLVFEDEDVLPDQISIGDPEPEPEIEPEPEAVPESEPVAESEPEAESADETEEFEITLPDDAVFVEYVSPEDEQSEDSPEPRIVEGELSVGRLVLYVIFGVVVCIPATIALFIADLFILGLGITAVSAAFITISLAFVGLNVIADIMLLIGAGIMMAALGLPLIALSVWGFPRYVIGFVRYVIQKGREWSRARSEEEVAEEW